MRSFYYCLSRNLYAAPNVFKDKYAVLLVLHRWLMDQSLNAFFKVPMLKPEGIEYFGNILKKVLGKGK